MRSFVTMLVLFVASSAPTYATHQVKRPVLGVRLVACATGPTPSKRFAVFTGSMPAIEGAARLEMRFDLVEHHGATPGFARVSLPRWGRWEATERPGAAGFVFTKRVEQLAAPAVYRAVVRFRWRDGDGNVLRRAKRVSPPCEQRDSALGATA